MVMINTPEDRTLDAYDELNRLALKNFRKSKNIAEPITAAVLHLANISVTVATALKLVEGDHKDLLQQVGDALLDALQKELNLSQVPGKED